MKVQNLHKTYLFIAFVLIIMSASACANASQIQRPTATSDPILQANVSMGTSDYLTAKSIKELVNKSTIIVSGKAIAQKEIINMARDVNNINQPDPNILGIGQVYQFEVNLFLKGTGPKTIYVVQPEGFLSGNKVGLNLVDSNLILARSQEKYIPIRLNNQFILFLEPLVGFPDLKNYYTGAIHPWRFDISNIDQAFPESPWDGALMAFPTRKVSDFINQIEHPDQASSSYPAPTSYP